MSLTKRWLDEEMETKRNAEKEACGCTYNMDDKFEILCPAHQAEEENFWGDPISIYTDADAQEDGILIDVSRFCVEFNGRGINRITCGAEVVLGLLSIHPASARTNLLIIISQVQLDGEGADAWGIFQPDPRFGNEKFWLVPNEVGGVTIMLPSEY